MATKKTTTSRRTTTRKTSTATKTAKAPTVEETTADLHVPTSIKTVDAPETPAVPAVQEAQDTPDIHQKAARKKELVDLAVARSGVKKRDAKPAIEAALAIMGEMVADGRELNLQPFGKLKINRTKQHENGQVIIARIRQSEQAQDSAQSHSADEDGLGTGYIEAAE